MSSPIYEIAYALWFIMPAYAANALPVIFGRGIPIDMNKKLSDGKPIFGSHKTYRGFIAGLIAGFLVGAVEVTLYQSNYMLGLPDFKLPFQFNPLIGFMISLGALVGDLVHSFVKRRIGMVEGAPFPVADQLDFVVGAILFSFLVSGSPPPFLTIVLVVVITPPVHLFFNYIAFLLGVKKTPW
jgi:CDP-2,3-bis-(O-geranylgeranyl)-sn-glycerol synthase